jgi:hypothetical protein
VKCERQFGFETFQIAVPTLPPGVVINNPKNLEFILKHEKTEGDFAKGAFFKRRSFDLFGIPFQSCIPIQIAIKTNRGAGNGIINADGELWKVQRKAGMHFLNNANLNVLTSLALPQYLKSASKTLRALSKEQIINLEDTFLELTTQIMGKMAYDVS